MINLSHWKSLIVVPTLALFKDTPLADTMMAPWRINQLTGTTKESLGLTWLMQIDAAGKPVGPAVGAYQMEPATHDDIWKNFLLYQQRIATVVFNHLDNVPHGGLIGANSLKTMVQQVIGQSDRMIWDLQYATLMAAIDYYRSPLPAPDNTAQALAQYHKDVYNTSLGASVAAEDVDYYQQAIDA